MANDSNAARVPLDRTTFLRLTGAAGTIIVCVSGCLWITRDGSPEDTLLQAGERYQVMDSTRVIATAFGPSVAALKTASTMTWRLPWEQRSIRASTR